MRVSRSHPHIALSLATFAAPRIARAEEVDKIVASVDGDPITMHDVRAFAESAGKAMPPGDPTQNETFKEGLKGMIAQKLLAEEVAKYDDKIDEGQIDRYIEDVEQERNISDQQLKQSLLQNGVSWDDFRKQAKERTRESDDAQRRVAPARHHSAGRDPGLLRCASATSSPSSRRNFSSRKF